MTRDRLRYEIIIIKRLIDKAEHHSNFESMPLKKQREYITKKDIYDADLLKIHKN